MGMQKVSSMVSTSLGDTISNITNWGGLFYNAGQYGIYPNGNDMTAMLQALVDRANSEGRTTIVLTAGNYTVTSITNDSNIVYFGDGAHFVGGYSKTINSFVDYLSISEQMEVNDHKLVGLQSINAPSKDRMQNFYKMTTQRNPFYIIGDSISEGANATNYVDDNWASIVRKGIQREADNTNYGYCNFNLDMVDISRTAVTTFHKVTLSGFSIGSNLDPLVFGGTQITSMTTNDYIDIAFTGKDAIVVYTSDPAGAIIEVSVDGVVTGSIDTKVTNGITKASFSQPIIPSSDGAHTIRLKNTGGKVQLCGMVYLDNAWEYSPVVYNVGRTLITANEIPDEILEFYGGAGTAVLALGVNDHSGHSIPVLKDKLRVVANTIQSFGGSLIICDFMFSLPQSDPYKVALAEVAKEYPDFLFLDFAKLWFGIASSNIFTGLLAPDGVHPTTRGHEMIGNTILKYMGLPYTKATIEYFETGSNPNILYPTLLNGWENYNPITHELASYYKGGGRIVHVQGMIKSGTTTAFTSLFSLPAGFRPSKDLFRPATCDTGAASIVCESAGDVRIVTGTNGYIGFEFSFEVA